MSRPLPLSLEVELRGSIATLQLNRPHKRNALDDETVLGIEAFFSSLPAEVRVVVIHAAGDHFSAGLDLSALGETSTFEGVAHSAMWHRIFAQIEFAPVPVVAVLKGAVIGGGLELATATHIRVAERSSFYALPEGQRGLFVGGGGSVRISRIIGAHRVADLMLTGRVLSADEGDALGLSHYLVDDGAGLDKGMELAAKIASNSPVSNFAIIHALPRIAESNGATGYLIESLISAIAQGSDEAKARMREFLDGRAARVTTSAAPTEAPPQ